MSIESTLIEIEQSEQYKNIQRQIIATEKQLLEIAPDDVKKLYHDIDFLCCLQTELIKETLINLR
jgi:hypothetical protein